MKFIRLSLKGMKSCRWLPCFGKDQKDEKVEMAVPAEPEKKEISIEEVRAVLAAKTQAGKRREVKELLLKYDSGKLSGVKPENYAALMADAEAL